MRLSANENRYVLLIKGDRCAYSWFYPTPSTSAEHATHAPKDRYSASGVLCMFMSDGPTHLKNSTKEELNNPLQVWNHFTLLYCPWSKGSFERLCEEVSGSLLISFQNLVFPAPNGRASFHLFRRLWTITCGHRAAIIHRSNLSPVYSHLVHWT